MIMKKKANKYIILSVAVIILLGAQIYLNTIGEVLNIQVLGKKYYGNTAYTRFEESSKEKKIYLTFDDGPSYLVTPKLLDILKHNEVKATFFIVGKEVIGREDILKRIYNEGHSIGLHTYTHNFKVIYKSDENFIHEMKKTAFKVNEILGITPTAIRFPGGSDRILNENMLEELHRNNFKVFDWNVNIEDGMNANTSPNKLLENSKKAKGNQNNRILLAHCNFNNLNTCKALSSIINYYKSEGFQFKTIDKETEEYYYKLRKR